MPKIAVPRVHPGDLERRRAAPDPQRPGRLDAQLRAERREGVHREGSAATTTRSTTTRRTRSRWMFDTRQYPYSLSAYRKAVSMAIDRNKVYKLGEYGYAPPDRRGRPERAVPVVGDRPGRQGRGEDARKLQPGGGEEDADGRGLHLQGQQAARPEGQPRQVRHPRDLGLVGLGRVASDHLQEPQGHRHRRERQARARLGLVVPERDEHEDS